jgi:hypothetical protein
MRLRLQQIAECIGFDHAGVTRDELATGLRDIEEVLGRAIACIEDEDASVFTLNGLDRLGDAENIVQLLRASIATAEGRGE